MRSSVKRAAAGLAAVSLLLAACGGDDDDSADTDTTEAPSDDTETTEAPSDDTETTEAPSDDTETTEAPMDELPLEGSVEVAAGTVLNLDECPDDWDPLAGITDDEIRIGNSAPTTGALAAFGAIPAGMQMYFDYVNATDPIDGKNLVVITKDDGYEAGRTVANVEEMIDSENVMMFAHLIGTPNNLAAREVTSENCVPQLWNSSGFPLWGDPANFPWTVGNILNYATETNIWCQTIKDEIGPDATIAALIMNNDFGNTYLNTLKSSETCAGLEILSEQLHDPAAPDINNEMTTLIATDADVLVAGTTAAFCPQTAANLAASAWRPQVYMSYTCNNLASFFTPVQDAAGLLQAEGSGVRMTNSNKVCGDPTFDGDEAIELTKEILAEYGDVTCADGSYSTGVIYGSFVVDLLRQVADMPGGLNRVNLMSALWNYDGTNPWLLGGTLKLDGVNDAYWTEAAQVQEVAVVDGSLTFVPVGDLVDFEGATGSYSGG